MAKMEDDLTATTDADAATLARSATLAWPVRKTAAKRAMTQSSGKLLPARIHVLEHARSPAAGGGGGPMGPIWQFWAQGFEAAPAIVRRCLETVSQCAAAPVTLLSERTMADHADLPGWLMDKRASIGWTAFSDVLRLALLSRHGGTWIDATCLQTAPMPPEIESEPLFVFRRDSNPMILSSWFIRAVPGHSFIETALAAALDYWAHHDRPHDYFWFHHLIEALVVLHRPCAETFAAIPAVSSRAAHCLQYALREPYSPQRLIELTRQSWLHKLSYKLDPPPEAGSIGEVIASGNLSVSGTGDVRPDQTATT